MKRILLGWTLLFSLQLFSQDSAKVPLTFSAYTEVYYQYDLNKPADNRQPGFIYSHNRHNEFNLNLGYLKVRYTDHWARANLALAGGTYIQANYSAEPAMLKNVFEANVGVKLIKKKNLWLDAGIFASHIGFESAVGKDCWNLTRSILAENSPYFEAGAKITYTSSSDKWIVSILALNGWQRITRVNGNSLMSWGMQVQFKPSDKLLINYSNFIGTDKPDSARLLRFFHNLYGILSITNKLGLTLGFDIGTEEKNTGSGNNIWYSPVLIFKYAFNKKWAIAGRFEYYRDRNGVIIATGSPNGFQSTGYSIGIDHNPIKNMVVRLEARNLHSKDNIFIKPSGYTGNDAFITSALAVSF